MENIFKNKLYKLFKKDARLWDKERKEFNETLLKDLIDKLDKKLIELLLGNKDTKEKFFVKKELQCILNLYAKMVSNGTWKDYSFTSSLREISFDVYLQLHQ
jgi:hypothetical protein